MDTIESIVEGEIEELVALLGVCQALRSELHRLAGQVNAVTAKCWDAGLRVDGSDVRPVLRAGVDAALAELFTAAEGGEE